MLRRHGLFWLKTCPRLNVLLNQSIPIPHLLHSRDICQQRWYAKGKRRNQISKKELKPLNFSIPNYISVNKLANLLNCRVERLIKDLTALEYVELILQEYNFALPNLSTSTNLDNVYDELKSPVNPKLLTKRAPVVTIMGHVDHGKTTIIDYLRKSSVVAQEHGGITQHIGAFQITAPKSGKKITFLDTPGHAAFLKMRERGANITDIIVLVVSVEDSLMPQTLEAIKHAKNSGNEMIIAITKIDRIPQPKEREKKIEKVINDLIVQGIPVEKIGGDVQVIPISAKTGENMDLLEESIVLLSEVMDIRAENSPKTIAEGWIIESQVKKQVGNVATVLVKKGTLQKGKILICGNTFCKIKNLIDDKGIPILKATPSYATEVLGWKDVPHVGDEVIQVKSEAIAKKFISKRQDLIEVQKNSSIVEKLNEERALAKEQHLNKELEHENTVQEHEQNTGPKLINYIIKCDVSGSAEAVSESISSLGNDEVRCNVISSSVGIPTESDLKMAQITESTILCFNLGNLPSEVINNRAGIKIKQYNVIYKLIEDVTETLTENLKPIFEKKIVSTVDVRETFDFRLKKKIIKIAGCKVNNGVIKKNSLVQVVRGPNEDVIFDGKISTLKHNKDDVAEVSKGHECGITFESGFEGFKPGDKILVYENVRVPRYL
ncbi:translation initiation factor IF-2 [Saccharomyces pastorianus]|uniref:Translation initiation factor IF-2, mitochondrial n=1 Tax=Saccharomyces pastorianus TaxID=27292 RepID=A0A6C1E018_SACPS|nr:translation initiation factor IF-2 [Saccharomyces pastorianus]